MITVIPSVSIASSVVSDGTVTIAGSGFGDHAEGSGTSVTQATAFGTGQQEAAPAEIVSWSDTEIVARVESPPDSIAVNSLFGTAAAKVEEVPVPDSGGDSGTGNGGDGDTNSSTDSDRSFSFGGGFGLESGR